MKPIGQPQTRSYSEHELAALEKWYDLLKAGEATVKIEDRMDSVRYLKVSRRDCLEPHKRQPGISRCGVTAQVEKGQHSRQNVWNCCWSSIQGLIRGTPETFVEFDETEVAPLKQFMREVVETGFKSGLLSKGMIQYPSGEQLVDSETTTENAWTWVSRGCFSVPRSSLRNVLLPAT